MLVIKNPSTYNYGYTQFKKKNNNIFPPAT